MNPLPTSEIIFQAAVELFASFGFPATSMRQIAKKAEVNVSTIYFYFGSKDGLLQECFSRFKETMSRLKYDDVQLLELITRSDPVEFMLTGLRKYYEFVDSSDAWKLWYVISNEQYRDESAGYLVLSETKRIIESTAKIFRVMMDAQLIRQGEPELFASEYQYTNRAIHLEYMIRKQFDLDVNEIVTKAERHVVYFMKSILRES